VIKVVTIDEMKAVEREADANGLTYALMMEHAGNGLAEQILEAFHDLQGGFALGLVGSGNNGGDTLVALAQLAKAGWGTAAYLARPREKDDPLLKRVVKNGCQVYQGESDRGYTELTRLLKMSNIVMDGLLGTGFQLPLHGKIGEVLDKTKQVLMEMPTKPSIVAVDCPSGIDCATGQAAHECLTADITVTMAAVKQGMLAFPANDLIGDLRVVSIGLEENDSRSPTWQNIHRWIIEPNWVRSQLPARERDAHKGTFGTALIAAGSVNFTGAALLAGKAAYRCGAGLVTLAVIEPLYTALAGQFPEATWLILPDESGVIEASGAEVIQKNLERVTALLLGPGFGMEDTTRHFLERLLSEAGSIRRGGIGFVPTATKENSQLGHLPPLVIDADGLKLLAKINRWSAFLPAQTVLTPHPGEMAVLTGLPVQEIQANRLGIAERFAKEWGHVVVLKGANSIVASPDGRTLIIPVATPALARAGTGDVLAGLIVGLRAQGLPAFEAAACGCFIHAQSGINAEIALGADVGPVGGRFAGGNLVPGVTQLF
jgi:NAD(P)H-hydrate epimerase